MAGVEDAGSPEELEFTSSAELPVEEEPAGVASPGLTVATIPVVPLPEPMVERLPPVRISELAEESLSGSRLGKP